MTANIKGLIRSLSGSWILTIRQINEKYSKPRIKITRGVAFSLFALRIYLLVLVVLLFYKFFTLLK